MQQLISYKTILSALDALGIWVILASLQLLIAGDILTGYPPVGTLTAKIAIEVAAICLLLRVSASSIIADIIDIAIFLVLFRVLLLEAYLLKTQFYDLFYSAPSDLFTATTYALTIMRLCWSSLNPANPSWPVLGVFGLTRHPNRIRGETINYLTVLAAIIIACEVAAILMWYFPKWIYITPALAALYFFFRYNERVRNNARAAVDAYIAQGATIEDLKEMIIRAAEVIDELEKQAQQQHGDTPPGAPPPKGGGPVKLKRIK